MLESFLIKLQELRPATLLKIYSNTDVFMWKLRYFQEELSSQNTSGGCFWLTTKLSYCSYVINKIRESSQVSSISTREACPLNTPHLCIIKKIIFAWKLPIFLTVQQFSLFQKSMFFKTFLGNMASFYFWNLLNFSPDKFNEWNTRYDKETTISNDSSKVKDDFISRYFSCYHVF